MRWMLLVLLVLQSTPEEGQFESAGVPIQYWTLGEGEAVLLIHGYAASSEVWTMSGVARRLAEDYEVIGVDCRGHGRSGKPHGAENYGVAMVDDLVALLDHLQIEQAHVVGYSMGGMVGLKMATTDPDRLRSLVAGGYGWSQDLGGMVEVAAALEAGEGFGPLLEDLTPEEERTPEQAARTQAMEQQLLSRNDPLALAGAARGFAQLELRRADLEANTVPILCVIGGEDPLKEDVDRMVGVMENLRVEVIDGADHMSAGRSPRFLSLVHEFVKSHSEPVAAGQD